MKNHIIARAAVAGTAGLLLALAAPLAASAHVTISPGDAAPGSYALLTVKVPNESATATTTAIEVKLPADTPFASVSYVPVPGWTAELVTSALPEPVTDDDGDEVTEAVTSVVWTADGAGISAGQLQTFGLSVGPVPDTDTVVFPAIQTYSDGKVVEWVEKGEDAEHPAPVVQVAAAAASEETADDETDAKTASTDGTTASSGSGASASSTDVLARVFGVGGLLVGAVGIVLAVTARRRAAA